jgi:hypothetical protein
MEGEPPDSDPPPITGDERPEDIGQAQAAPSSGLARLHDRRHDERPEERSHHESQNIHATSFPDGPLYTNAHIG